MLKNLLDQKEQKRQTYLDERLVEFEKKYDEILELKTELEKHTDGLIDFEVKYKPNRANISEYAHKSHYPVLVVNKVGHRRTHPIHICGNKERLGVSSLDIFPLMGERHTIESFLKKLVSRM